MTPFRDAKVRAHREPGSRVCREREPAARSAARWQTSHVLDVRHVGAQAAGTTRAAPRPAGTCGSSVTAWCVVAHRAAKAALIPDREALRQSPRRAGTRRRPPRWSSASRRGSFEHRRRVRRPSASATRAAMSACIWNTPLTSPSNGCCQRLVPVDTSISSGLTRTRRPPPCARFPPHRPSQQVRDPKLLRRSAAESSSPRSCTEPRPARAVTANPRSAVSLPRTSSVMPSAK